MTEYGFSSMKQQHLAEEHVDSEATDNFDDQRGNIVEFENGEEYLIFDDYDEAEKVAVDYVREMLNDEPETFVQSWLQQYISLSETDKNVMSQETAENYVYDIKEEDDGRRVVEEAGMEDEYDEIQEKIDEYEEKDKDTTKLELKKERLIDEAAEKVEEEMREDHYNRLDNAYEYFVNEEGIYSPEDFFKQFGYAIDVDEAAQDAVDTDGVAHFFAGYDGNQVDLDDGTVMYRVN